MLPIFILFITLIHPFIWILTMPTTGTKVDSKAQIHSYLLIIVSIFSQTRVFNPISYLVHFSVEN